MADIREATGDALPAILPLLRALKQQHGDPAADTVETLHAAFLGPARVGSMLVAWAGPQAIGYVTAFPSYETGHAQRGAYVGDLFVADAHRRQGLGRALLAAVAARAAEQGASYLWWVAQPRNTEAHAFYRRLADIEDPLMAFAATGEAFARLVRAA